MAVAPIFNDPGNTPPPEPFLTPADVIARAEAIAPSLIARQAETEERTFYAIDTHEELLNAGLYRILVPRRYGGYEFGLETFLKVVMALARGCPSTGWMYGLGAAHAMVVATLFDEAAQQELFSGGDFISPAAVAPSGTAERADDGGWIINGTWPYCSGAPYATHFIGHTLVFNEDGMPAPMLFIVPRDQWTRHDDWGQTLGLKGSGSHSITVDNAHIPAHFVLEYTHMSLVDVSKGTPGRALHDNPEYGGGPLSSMLFNVAALSVGMAKGALDAYEELLLSKQTSFLPIVTRVEDVDYQNWYGQAAGLVATAEAAILNAAQQWRETAAGPAEFTREQDLRLATICREVEKLSWQAVEGNVYRTAGSSAVRNGERIERIWRDLSMVHSHAGFAVYLGVLVNRDLAKARFHIG
jgi:3-hydroxy-9,10-secoandrosta-1,3,5(10)-triene-9,17-dione monooxygenase